jgi:hypothetical protein
VDDSWIYFGPPQTRILAHTVNAGDYEVGFDQRRSDGSARGLNALKFSYGGADTGHLAAAALTGSFIVKNTGDNRTYADILLLVAIDADALPSGFAMSLGLQGETPYEFDPLNDFGYYDHPTYDTGRPSGYYSATSPYREGISYSFETGMVTVLALPGVDLGPFGETITIEYAFAHLPGAAVFSVYGYDGNVGWVFHSNRALIDENRPGSPVSTFEIMPLPGDFDGDGQVDLDDYAHFADCMAGPNIPPDPAQATVDACLIAFDFDLDNDVDLRDYAAFDGALTE